MELSPLSIAIGAGVVVAAADKLVEQFWPNSRVNSIFDILATAINVLVVSLGEKPRRVRVEKPVPDSASLELFRVGGTSSAQRAEAIGNRERTEGRVSRALADLERRTPEQDPRRREYWERADIQAWAAANPGLAAAAKRRHGYEG